MRPAVGFVQIKNCPIVPENQGLFPAYPFNGGLLTGGQGMVFYAFSRSCIFCAHGPLAVREKKGTPLNGT